MAFRIIFIIISLLASLRSFAQQSRTDSLESLVKTVPLDTNKIFLLNTLVSSLREKDNNKALPYAYEAKDLAELLSYKKGLATALENLGWILYRKGDYTKSLHFSTQALKTSEEIHDRGASARALINIAAILFEQKQYDKAIDNFRKAHTESKAIGDKKTMARSWNNIGYSLLQTRSLDSAIYYVNNALKIGEAINDTYVIGFSNRTLADIYEIRKDFPSALKHLKRSLKIAEDEGNLFLKTSSLHRIAKVYKEIAAYEDALDALYESLVISNKNGYSEELERTYKLMAEIYGLKKDIPRAYDFQSRYLNIHDSLYTQRQGEQIALMQAKFDAEMKEKQIQLLTKEAQLNAEEINSQRVWLYFYIGCLLLFIVLVFGLLYTNRYNSIAKKQLEEKNKEINDQTRQLRNLNATKDKLFSIISHDLRSPLASLKALMELVGTSGLSQEEFVHFTRVLKQNLDFVNADLDNLLMWSQTQLRGIQAVPVPVKLRSMVEEKMTLFGEVAGNKNIRIINDIDENTIVFADKNHVSLILRNLIGNAIKFNPVGGAIVLKSTMHDDYHQITVADSGVGMSKENIKKLFNAETHFTTPGTNKEKGIGIGLLLTKEFIEKNDGSITVNSELGKGTTFTFTLKSGKQEVFV